VGATLAVAVARVRGIPLHAVPTLVAVAAAYAPAGAVRVCAVLDARRGRWYAARCEHDGAGWRSLEDPRDLAPDAVAVLAAGTPIVGMSLERLAPAIPALSDIAPVAASPNPAPVAQALAALVALAPSAYRLAAPAELRILYARSGVD
jgi:tRNA A37 threonylcarbamoyladenosine modification protein TsaB